MLDNQQVRVLTLFRMPGSVVEIDVINQETGVYFHIFFLLLET